MGIRTFSGRTGRFLDIFRIPIFHRAKLWNLHKKMKRNIRIILNKKNERNIRNVSNEKLFKFWISEIYHPPEFLNPKRTYIKKMKEKLKTFQIKKNFKFWTSKTYPSIWIPKFHMFQITLFTFQIGFGMGNRNTSNFSLLKG